MPGYIRKLAGAALLLASIAIFSDLAKWARAEVPAPNPAVTRRVASATDDFGFRLLKVLAKDPKQNTIISPLGIAMALAMAYNGAAGATKKEMAKTLGLGSLSDDDINRANHSLMLALAKADPAAQLEIANALWVQKDFPINPDFRKVCQSFYDASAANLDFIRDPKGAVAEINFWVDKNTHHRIPAIVAEIDPATRLILTDAVHFKGAWSSKFEGRDTRPRPFHLLSGDSRNTAMMEQTSDFLYLENKDFQAIRLPYGNERYAMYVFLPRKPGGLPDFLRSLDQKHWKQWTGRFASRTTNIILPKFETAYSEQLNDVLNEMGMKLAFDSSRADFSRIPLNPTPGNALYISRVKHKTWIKVDEEGTEAGAATSLEFELLARIGTSNVMIVDHPFFFAITEKQSGALLFAGVVMDPTLTGGAQ
ncbi:serpin family protein [Candidatus Binatus sp.]|uniref:serpin family protein n=1 Tax=Candidatus Binatus sp. TaxID=2811406 RepID=UPI003C85A8E2